MRGTNTEVQFSERCMVFDEYHKTTSINWFEPICNRCHERKPLVAISTKHNFWKKRNNKPESVFLCENCVNQTGVKLH